MNINWNATTYAQSFSFVPNYGEAVLDLIELPEKGRVLDLGCGTGELTQQMQERGWDVCGMDASPQMIERARADHPGIEFFVADARDFTVDKPYDVVFSNAMLHWIEKKDQSSALASVAAALKPGGQFVFEMGGAGCVRRIHAALRAAFEARGLGYPFTFYFPGIAEYATLLEAAGLPVNYAVLFERPTPLAGVDGMRDWINMFIQQAFAGMDSALAEEIKTEAVDALKAELLCDGVWYADYMRLRMRSVKAE